MAVWSWFRTGLRASHGADPRRADPAAPHRDRQSVRENSSVNVGQVPGLQSVRENLGINVEQAFRPAAAFQAACKAHGLSLTARAHHRRQTDKAPCVSAGLSKLTPPTRILLPILLACAAIAARAADAGRPESPTFYKDIEPILQNRCQSCHRPGEAAPMSLLTYSDARPWAKAIRAAVLAGKMPPWSPDPKYGKFSNDLSLAPEDRDKLVAWVDAGALEGKLSDAPKPKAFPQGWQIPEPDAVFELPEPFHVPPSGAIEYQFIRVPTNFTEDKWIQMAEVRPGNAAVVHHAIVMVEDPEYRSLEDYLGGYAPGMSPQIWKPSQARLVRAGSTLIFQMHYSANGKPAEDRTKIGLVFAKAPVTERIIGMQSMPPRLMIPPGAENFRVDGVATLHQDSKLVAVRAHMHLRGKSFQMRAVYPNGELEILLDIPKYDFNWQPYYYLETPKSLPRGTRIESTGYFDNSANNPFNPDPSATIFWGPQTWDEMMIGWFDVAVGISENALAR